MKFSQLSKLKHLKTAHAQLKNKFLFYDLSGDNIKNRHFQSLKMIQII